MQGNLGHALYTLIESRMYFLFLLLFLFMVLDILVFVRPKFWSIILRSPNNVVQHLFGYSVRQLYFLMYHIFKVFIIFVVAHNTYGYKFSGKSFLLLPCDFGLEHFIHDV